MAEKKPQDDKEKFEAEVYKLGLTLIENYRSGTCRDSNATLEAILELFKISHGTAEFFLLEGKSNGI